MPAGLPPSGDLAARQVTFVSQWFPPEPVSVPPLTARELAATGYRVSVLTGIPNLPEGRTYRGYRPWKFYREEYTGLRVLRTPLFPNHSTSALPRMANYVSWAISASIAGLPTLKRSDVNVVHCTPVTAAIPALVARMLFRVPYVLIIQDLWPDSVAASGFVTNKIASRLVSIFAGSMTRLLYRKASRLIAISTGMANLLGERGYNNVSVVFNSVEEEIYSPQQRSGDARQRLGLASDDFVLVYAGNQGAAQSLATLVQAVGSMPEAPRVRLILVGWGIERKRLEQLSKEVAPGRVVFVDRVNPKEVRSIQSSADLCVVSLKDDALFRVTVPSKLQTLMASGLPILGVVAGDAAVLIMQSRSGFIARPGDAQSVRNAIAKAVAEGPERLGARGREGHRYYRTEMSSPSRAAKLDAIVRDARL